MLPRLLLTSLTAALVAAAPASAAVSFGPGKTYPGTDASNGVAIADFDGNGRNDVAYTKAPFPGPGQIGVRMNGGTGALGAETGLTTNEQPQNLAAGDLNGDGRADLVTVTNNPGGQDSLTVFLSTGAGFGAPAVLETASGPRAVTLADMDGDGDLDAVVSGFVNERGNPAEPIGVAVHLNNGAGVLGGPARYLAADQREPTDVAVGNFNRDGFPDVAMADFNSGTGGLLHILLGTGGGALGGASTIQAPTDATEVIADDLNGDGVDDLVIGGDEPGILLANGSGGFGAGTTLRLGTGGTASGAEVGTGDFDADGTTDVVTTTGPGLRVFTGSGRGTFTLDPGQFKPGDYGRAFAAGDLNGDRVDDVVATSFGLAVYLTRPPTAGFSAVPRGCARPTFNARVRVTGPFKSVDVKLDGKRIKRSTRASFTVKVRAARAGSHRLQAVVTTRAGRKLTTSKSFKRC